MAKNLPKVKASTQEHLDIDDILDDLVILKTGWVALVMSTTAVNFDLLSEAEQDATIYAYGAFLNSLSFPVEVLVRSKKADITSYFASLEEAEAAQPNPDLKRQIQKYKDFIQSTVQQKTVLDKKFYLVINFSPMERGIGGARPQKNNSKTKAELISDAKVALMPKRDHVIKQTARLGLTTKQLVTQELIELFYDIYNPAPTGTQRVLLDTESYTTPIVEPALEVPTPAPKNQVNQYLSESQNRNMGVGNSQNIAPEPKAPSPISSEQLRPVAPAIAIPNAPATVAALQPEQLRPVAPASAVTFSQPQMPGAVPPPIPAPAPSNLQNQVAQIVNVPPVGAVYAPNQELRPVPPAPVQIPQAQMQPQMSPSPLPAGNANQAPQGGGLGVGTVGGPTAVGSTDQDAALAKLKEAAERASAMLASSQVAPNLGNQGVNVPWGSQAVQGSVVGNGQGVVNNPSGPVIGSKT